MIMVCTILQRVKKLIRAEPEWGPAVAQNREDWLQSHGRNHGNYMDSSEMEKLNAKENGLEPLHSVTAELMSEKLPIV
jgi:hypothetical protein